MRKLPVLATAGRAYFFLFQELGTIFRLSWFPLLLTQVVTPFIEWKWGSIKDNWIAGLAAILLSVTGISIVAVSLHRVILFNDRHSNRYFHMDFGKVEFLFVIMPFVTWVSIVIVAILLVMLPPIRSLLSALGSFSNEYVAISIMALPFLYLIFRLFIIFPVMVVERRIDLVRAWELTRGNGWRLIAVVLLTSVVLLLIDGAVEKSGEILAESTVLDLSFWATANAWIYRTVYIIISGALGVAALSYSYKFLTGHEPDEIVTPQV